MKKNMIRGWVILAILLIAYNLILFVAPFLKTADFWISYVFTMLAFLIAAFTIYIAFIKKPDAKSRFYGFPIARIGIVYLSAQLVVSFILILLGKFIPFWITLIIYIVGLVITVLGLVSTEAVVEEIQLQDDSLKAKVDFMRSLQSQVSHMTMQCNDPDTLKHLQNFAEDLRYSDPISSEALSEIESKLSIAITNLQNAVDNGYWPAVNQSIQKATALLAERNRLCKLNK